MSKTKEIVFHRPSPRNYFPPAEIPGIERVVIAKLLGLWLQPDLGTRKHIEYIMQICNQQFYLLSDEKKVYHKNSCNIYLKQLLFLVFYMVHMHGGVIHIADIEGVQKMLDKAKRWPIVVQDFILLNC